LIGNVVEKYEVIQKIGEGGMATVYRGRHTTLGREVAIKVLHPHLSASERNRMRFAREARAIEHLEHDNILKIFDYSGSDTDRCYIVTEFIDGITLQDLLNERARFPSEVVAQVGIKLARALSYAHNLGIIHRDLKLENVMLKRDGGLKLMDFGIARFLDEVNLTVTGALIGSPAYMSPEQAMERVLDRRSDLFSLGTLLFHLITGQLPFSGANPSIVLRNVIEGNRPSLLELAPDVSSALGDLVEQLMQTEPDDRPQSADDVIIRLQTALAQVDIPEDDQSWSIDRWLQSVDDYQARLNQHLTDQLLDKGKAALVAGDHLTALRLLNRLLSMDGDNEEVLNLLRGMHADMPSTRRWNKIWPVSVGLVLAVGGLVHWAWPEDAVQVPIPVGTVAASDADADAEDDAPEGQDAPPAVVATQAPSVVTAPPEAVRAIPSSPNPAPVASAPASKKADPELMGTVVVTVPGSWGDIFIDGEAHGRTGQRGDIAVTPGTHTLEIRNDHALPHQQSFTVEPGERRVIEVTGLQRKPVRFRLLDPPSPECVVMVDGIERGTVATMANTIRVRSPERPHNLTLQCPGDTTLTKTLGPAAPGSLVPVRLQ